jgi:hypothetical protein
MRSCKTRLARQPNCVFDPFGFEILVNLGIGEAGVGTEIDAREIAAIASHDRAEDGLPAVGAVHIAGTQRTALKIAELVEHE